jgi:FKBP-type peptidyl-prolyl cis-trans isomerase
MLTKRWIPIVVASVTALALLGACGGDEPESATGDGDTSGCETGTEQEVTDGLTYVEIECGDGDEAQPGDSVTVHYTGTLEEDGSEFDSSVGGEPFTFTIGAGMVIQGWEQGVPGMRVGGTRELTIAPDLAYGGADSGHPLGGKTLIFEVELLEIQANP